MRSSFIKAVCVAVGLSSPWIAYSQNYYVVVGAFAAKGKASEFRGFLPIQVTDTSYTLSDENLSLEYYVIRMQDKESASNQAMQLKKVLDFLRTEGVASEKWRTDPSALATTRPVSAESTDASSGGAIPDGAGASAGNIPAKPVGKYFKFNIESPEGKPVMAQLHHVDLEEGREVAAYNSNTYVDLSAPGNSRKRMAVVCGLFGYKEVLKYIDYSNPARMDKDAYMDENGTWVIPYKLDRVEKGDVSTMYNVSFYKDAAIMRKESKVDLDELVRMMHMNPYYEITIHAHCNGKNKRDIIAAGPDGSYFDVEGSITMKGTAKDLTELRAESIRGYLMDHGIEPGRIEIFSWGASDMMVKADSPDAEVNNRIEIEFTRD